MACLCCIAGGHAPIAYGQGYDSWSKVEQSEETRTYTQVLGEGTFDGAQLAVLERIILPQLQKPANRPTIAQVRQRIRDIITRGTSNPKMFDAVNKVTADNMVRLAADESQDILVRVNAIVLLRDLIAADRKAWPGSIEPLAKAVGDAKLPMAVRVAAMTGLVRQVDAGRSSDPAFAKAVGPVVTNIVTQPPEGDPRAVAWLIGRCFDLAPIVGSAPQVMEAAAKVLADEKADLDLRVRAAVALGRLVKPGSAPDLTAAVAQIRELATAALAADLAEAEARRFAKQLSGATDTGTTGVAGGTMTPPPPPSAPPGVEGFFGGGIFGGEPAAGGGASTDGQLGIQVVVDPDAVPAMACRRNAWRLVSLADALQPEASKDAGIASVLTGDAAAPATELATVLRAQGLAIESARDEASVKEALAAIEGLAAAAQPDAPDAAPGTPALPTPPTTPPADSPFGGGSDSSPF
jgi:hypothetical protein